MFTMFCLFLVYLCKASFYFILERYFTLTDVVGLVTRSQQLVPFVAWTSMLWYVVHIAPLLLCFNLQCTNVTENKLYVE